MKFINQKSARNITMFVALLLAVSPVLAEETKPSEEKAAVVNGTVITRQEYQKELNFHLQRASQQGLQISDEQMTKLKNDVLESLIEREILFQQSQKSGISVDAKAIDEQLAVIKKRFPTEDEFKKALNLMQLSEEDVKLQIKKGLAIKALIDEQIAQKIVISDADSKAYYDSHLQLFQQPEEVKASHILIKVEPNADQQKKAEAKQKIMDVQKKLKSGQDFAELAKEYSEGPSNVQGGDLGYFKRGQMVKPFEDAAFAMKPDEVSDIVETQFGYHLIKVYDIKPEKTLTYAEVKDRLTEQMKQQKIEEEAVKYIDSLKKDAKIEKM